MSVPVQDAAVQTCDCTGNCGQAACRSALNRKMRKRDVDTICGKLASSQGFSRQGRLSFFCAHCCCELDGCHKQRQRQHGGEGRWCTEHVPRHVDKSDYHNRFGTHKADPAWSEELTQVLQPIMYEFTVCTYCVIAEGCISRCVIVVCVSYVIVVV